MRVLLFVAFAFFASHLRAEEPFFKKGDVIAIVGGEDMVALSEYGYLELLLTRALPDYHLRFRGLAWEGDTVFEQRRDLNFPTWEEALEKIGATVVLCQFGQMESLDGKEKLPEFIVAYEKLLGRFGGGGERRVAVLAPNLPEYEHYGNQRFQMPHVVAGYWEAAEKLARRLGSRYVPGHGPSHAPTIGTRDGYHRNAFSHRYYSGLQMSDFGFDIQRMGAILFGEEKGESLPHAEDEQLRQLIIAKNGIWFDYWRVQNWAFLAGDRTNQPSSRDHLDPARRWFPEEREKFLPLLETKEKEIDALAAKLAYP